MVGSMMTSTLMITMKNKINITGGNIYLRKSIIQNSKSIAMRAQIWPAVSFYTFHRPDPSTSSWELVAYQLLWEGRLQWWGTPHGHLADQAGHSYPRPFSPNQLTQDSLSSIQILDSENIYKNYLSLMFYI